MQVLRGKMSPAMFPRETVGADLGPVRVGAPTRGAPTPALVRALTRGAPTPALIGAPGELVSPPFEKGGPGGILIKIGFKGGHPGRRGLLFKIGRQRLHGPLGQVGAGVEAPQQCVTALPLDLARQQIQGGMEIGLF